MPHPRELMIDAVIAQLSNKTAAGARVIEAPMVPWRQQQLPAIGVFDPTEDVDDESARTAPRELRRSPELVIECALKVSDGFVQGLGKNLNKALNRFADQVERAISADDTLGGTVSDVWLSATKKELMPEGDQLIGILTLTFSVEYYQYAPLAEDVPLEDFESADVHYSLGGEQAPEDQAHDLLELEG